MIYLFNILGFNASMEYLQKFDKSVAKNLEATVRLMSAQIELLLNNKDANGSVVDIQTIRVSIFNWLPLI